MKVLNKAAKQGRLTDLTKMLKNTKIYSKYFKKGYLPKDTKDNIMFNKEQDGTHLVHMGINRHPGQEERRTVGGPYVRKDIMDKLHIDPTSIKTSKDVEKLAEKMKNTTSKMIMVKKSHLLAQQRGAVTIVLNSIMTLCGLVSLMRNF